MARTNKRIDSLAAGAAASLMLVSLVGLAAITGLLPSSHGIVADNSRIVAQPVAALTSATAFAVAPTAVQQTASPTAQAQQFVLVPVQAQQQAAAPGVVKGVGAVIGGLVASRVGGGSGKTLATIAGAVGGYLGNEVGKRNF